MSRTFVSIATTLLVVAVLAPAAIGGAAADEVTLTVNVVDSDGNAVGSGVEVVATWNDSSEQRTGTTAPNGQVLFGVPDGVTVELQVQNSRYIRNVPYVVEGVGDQTVEMPVSLSGTATVTVENANGQRVADANTVLFNDRGTRIDEQTTGQDGTVTTGAVERDSYGLWVNKPGFVTNRTGVTVDADSVNRTVVMRRGSVEVRFYVTDDHFEEPRPLENATVNIQNGASLPTLSDGTASTALAVNRAYSVTVSKPGYERVTETLRVGEEPARLNASIQRQDALTVEPDRAEVLVNNTVDVTVTDEYSEPVEGATVSVAGSTIGETDANGELTVPIDSTGDVTISVAADGQSAETTVRGVTAAPDETPTATATDTPTETATDTATETPSESGPGFGIIAAVAALGLALLARRR
jgi:PGF-CTERM protein